MLAKLIVHGRDREEAIRRARQALRDCVILGCQTNAAFLERVLGHHGFAAGEVETGFASRHADALAEPPIGEDEQLAILATAALVHPDFVEHARSVPEPFASIGAWRN